MLPMLLGLHLLCDFRLNIKWGNSLAYFINKMSLMSFQDCLFVTPVVFDLVQMWDLSCAGLLVDSKIQNEFEIFWCLCVFCNSLNERWKF